MNLPAFAWLIIIPLLATPLIYVAGRVGSNGDTSIPNPARWAALLALLLAWTPFVLAANDLANGGTTSLTLESVTLRFDGLSLLVTAVTLALGTLVVLYSGPYMARETGEE